MIKSEKIKKVRKKEILKLLLGLLLTVIGISIVAYQEIKEKKILDNPVAFVDAKSGDYSYLDVNITPYLFAEYDKKTDSSKYYFALDKDNILYIVYLPYKTYTMLNNIKDLENNPIRLKGMAYPIPDSVKKIGIDVYNEDFSNILTEDNFNKYFGYVFLDTTYVYQENEILYIAGFSLAVFGITLISLYIIYFTKTKKNLKKITESDLDKIWEEIDLDNDETTPLKIYLLKDYLFILKNGIDIIKYEDIAWVYPHEFSNAKVITTKSIVIYTKDGKKHETSKIDALNRKKLDLYSEVYHKIISSHEDIITGFTPEDRKKVKELYKF